MIKGYLIYILTRTEGSALPLKTVASNEIDVKIEGGGWIINNAIKQKMNNKYFGLESRELWVINNQQGVIGITRRTNNE